MKKRGERIGLIADSHGDLEATRQAIGLLKRRGASLLIHLGDFCDSVRHERSAAMISLLREQGIPAVKGNNDFAVENRLAGSRRPLDADGIGMLAYLRDLPLVRVREAIRFAHSLPFDTFRAFYEPIDTGGTDRAKRVFDQTDCSILFCGHSHRPVRFRYAGGRVTRMPVEPGRPEVLEGAARHIVVVGAVSDGECALYDEVARSCERLRTG